MDVSLFARDPSPLHVGPFGIKEQAKKSNDPKKKLNRSNYLFLLAKQA